MSRSAASFIAGTLVAVVVGSASMARAGSEFPMLRRLVGQERLRFWKKTAGKAGSGHLADLDRRIARCPQPVLLGRVLNLALKNLTKIHQEAVTSYAPGCTKWRIRQQAIGLAEVTGDLCELDNARFTYGRGLSAYQNTDPGYHQKALAVVRRVLAQVDHPEPEALVALSRTALRGVFPGEEWRPAATVRSLKRYLDKEKPTSMKDVLEFMENAVLAYGLTEAVLSDPEREFGVIAVEGKGQAVQVTRPVPITPQTPEGLSHTRLRYTPNANPLEERDYGLKRRAGVLIMLDQDEQHIRLEMPTAYGSGEAAKWEDSCYIPFPSMPNTGDRARVRAVSRIVDVDGRPLELPTEVEFSDQPSGSMMEGIGFE